MIKKNIQTNFVELKRVLRKPKVNNYKLPKVLELKYTFIPVALLVIFVFYNFDARVENYIKHSLPSSVNDFFQYITVVGKAEYILIICAVLVLVRLFWNVDNLSEKVHELFNRVTAYAGFILATVAISGIFGQILKMIIGRARPKFFLQYGSHYFEHFHAPGYNFASMPSGHSITVGAMFLALFFIFPRLKYLWFFLIILIASSRVFVGSHYPSDVIFGVTIGCYSTAYIYYWMRNRNII